MNTILIITTIASVVAAICLSIRLSYSKAETRSVRQAFENYRQEVEYRKKRPLSKSDADTGKDTEVPVKTEVIKYVDRIVEKRIEVPVEKQVIKYVDRIVEKKVETVYNPTEEERMRIIGDANKRADEIIVHAELKAEDEAYKIVSEAENEAERIRKETEEHVKAIDKRRDFLDKFEEELDNRSRLTSYNYTRSENLRKEALELKREAKQIRDDAVSQGSEYLDDLCIRVSNLLDVTRIDDESAFNGLSRELNERRKAHRKRMKEDVRSFASADFHALKYDSQKVCLLAVHYCDLLVDKLVGNVRNKSMEQSVDLVRQAISTVEAMFPASIKFNISDRYIQAKKEELQLAFEIEAYKLEQKEFRRKELEAKREEAKAQKELEAERKQAERDEMKAQAAIERSRFEMAQAKTQEEMEKFRSQISRLEEALKKAQERRERAISMAQQTKCGYVYVISNIGSFGEDVYKIGMTRRVEPMDRVTELGDASVPFPFDVHAMIYTEDAPSLESELHRSFDRYKLNCINGRKEFFRVPLHEIREQVEKFGIVCEWVEKPAAKQYRDSQYLKQP